MGGWLLIRKEGTDNISRRADMEDIPDINFQSYPIKDLR
jgi:hypothetical protein